MAENWERIVAERLSRIETKLDAITDLPKRVASLERWRSWVLGALALAAAAIGLLAKYG